MISNCHQDELSSVKMKSSLFPPKSSAQLFHWYLWLWKRKARTEAREERERTRDKSLSLTYILGNLPYTLNNTRVFLMLPNLFPGLSDIIIVGIWKQGRKRIIISVLNSCFSPARNKLLPASWKEFLHIWNVHSH